jgi:hypothetical protein
MFTFFPRLSLEPSFLITFAFCWLLRFESYTQSLKFFKHKAYKKSAVKKVAYLRKEKETVEIDYPLGEIWAAIPKALTSLEWTAEQVDDTAHHVKAKTKAGFISYASLLLINAVAVDEKTARVTVTAETPVTTITSIFDFGRTRDRIELFFEALAKQLTIHENTG